MHFPRGPVNLGRRIAIYEEGRATEIVYLFDLHNDAYTTFSNTIKSGKLFSRWTISSSEEEKQSASVVCSLQE